jgi:hypothetical protein
LATLATFATTLAFDSIVWLGRGLLLNCANK